MNWHGSWLVVLAVAYLLGSVPFGFLIVKLSAGRDVRAAGSGNIGATNVGRVAGKGAGLLTLVLDVSKGALAVWLASRWMHGDINAQVMAAVAAVVGHMFPVWLGFRGGKGVATGAGAFAVVCWTAVAAAMGVFAVVVLLWRYVSLGSILASAALPALLYALYDRGQVPPRTLSVGAVLVAALIILKHKDNIGRLIAGTENRLRFKK